MSAPRGLKAPARAYALPDDKATANMTAAVDNPVVVSAEFGRKALEDKVDEVRGELLPTLSVSTGVTRAFESSSQTGRLDTAQVTLNLTVPLYQQGEVFSRLREAKQDVAEQVQIVDKARRDAIEEATRAWESLVTARARVKSFKAQIKANVVALEGVEREAQVGSRTVLDVLDAEQELLDSRVAHVRAQRDELVAGFELKESKGQLTTREMQLPVEYYDPTGHYRGVRNKWFGGAGQDGEQ